MRSKVRFSLLALVIGLIVAVIAPAVAQAAFGVERFVATNCKSEAEQPGSKKCGSEEAPGPVLGPPPNPAYVFPKKEVTVSEAEKEGFTQAGGRVPFGITDFSVNHSGEYPNAKPEGTVDHVRVDVATGLATAPVAVPTCTTKEFGDTEAVPGTGFYTKTGCASDTEIGEEKVTLYVEALKEFGFTDLPLEGQVYNLEQPEGLASYYGVALKFPLLISKGSLEKAFAEKPLPEEDFKGETKAQKEAEKKFTEEKIENEQYYVHSFVKGNVEWGKQAKGTNEGDYHDYFEVEVNPADPLISSRQTLYGTSGEGDFITNATNCPGDNTTFVTLEDTAGETKRELFKTPIGLNGCGSLLFEPTYSLASGSTASDQPNEITTSVSVPSNPKVNAQSQVKAATITLPEGMTLNPSAAHGLEACTVAAARIHGETFGSECPAGSELGTISLNVPTLPDGSFTGTMYLGGPIAGPETGPITGPPYIVYVVANSKRYGISVRIKGEVTPNATTGQVTAVFKENPEQPFTNLSLHFSRGVLTSIANPLICGTPTGSASFTPVAPEVPTVGRSFGVAVTGCASTLPFALTQSTANQATNGGTATSYTLNIARTDGQQYLSQIQTTLPAGLIGLIPTVTQCGEAEANAGTCSSASKIGVVGVEAGAGPTPYGFSGNVYLTGPYNGAPFGLSVVVPAIAGPFNLGNVITRGTLTVNPYTARVTATTTLPRVVGGIPLRLKRVAVNINRQGFLVNPTNCGALSTDTTLSGFTAPALPAGVTQNLSTPFQVGACGGLSFKPSFKAKTSAKTSKANGASLETTLNIGTGQTNFKSILIQLPKQLPSRLTTLQKACPEAVFAANPFHCPSGSFVGGARANTPALPGKLQGPAILVSHAGLAFPDLDLVMEANGVRVILVGNTKITKGVTTTNFATPPDAPVSSITVNLPVGGHSAVTANGSLCVNPLMLPTTLTGQNGFVIKQNTKIAVASCGVRIAGKKVVGNTAYITVQTYSAGRISGGGSNLRTVYRHLSRAQKTATLKVPLSNGGARRGKPLRIKLRVGFVPTVKKNGSSASTTTVVFG